MPAGAVAGYADAGVWNVNAGASAARGSAFKTFEGMHHILQAGVAIVLLGHASAQESVSGAGTYGSTAAALSVAADRSISDVSVLSAALQLLMRTWVRVNFTAARYKTERPLQSYAPRACWATKPPEDQAAAAETRQKNANAVKALADAAGGMTALVSAGLDLTATLKMCGMPMVQVAQQAARSIVTDAATDAATEEHAS